MIIVFFFFFFKQKTAYEIYQCDWSSDVCSSDLFTGFLVHTSEGAAFRIRQFLNNPAMVERMGERGREHVRTNFLITRQIRDYLSVWYVMENNGRSVFEL